MKKLLPNRTSSAISHQESFSFFKEFLLREIGLITVGVLLYVLLISIFSHQHQSRLMTGFVILFSISKVAYFLFFTLYRVENHLSHSASSFYRCMISFGSVTVLLILSFTLDYLCLSDCNAQAFSGIASESPILVQFFEFNCQIIFFVSKIIFK